MQGIKLIAKGILLFSLIKVEILPFVTTWISLEGITLNEPGQEDKCCMISRARGT